MNRQSLATTVTCLGNGHDGIGNIIMSIGTKEQPRKILDWFHLKENLYKVGGSIKRLRKAEALGRKNIRNSKSFWEYLSFSSSKILCLSRKTQAANS
ncbi:MAG: hypothetical protein GDA48_04530 [Hormoscilla sp. GM102CHS1]|nr:hypothetical protein [Hormoscilla sp. GM102CHS1]